MLDSVLSDTAFEVEAEYEEAGEGFTAVEIDDWLVPTEKGGEATVHASSIGSVCTAG